MFVRHIVHTNRYSKHGGKCKQVCANVAISECTMVCSPVGHDGIYVPECTITGQPGHKPGSGPGRIGPFIKNTMNLIRQFDRMALSYLQYGSHSLNNIDPAEGYWHLANRFEGG